MAVPAPDVVRVVLIDDHELVAEALELALRPHGVEVVGRAGTLREGVALVASLQPSAVLLDFRLPDGDGIEGVAAVEASAPGTAVLVVTAVADERTAVDVLAAGARGYLTKDAPITELVSAVRSVASGETVIPSHLHGALLGRLRSPSASSSSSEVVPLTAKEQEVLALLATGLGIGEVAETLFISRNTARKHVQSVLQKLGAHTQLEAVAIARRTGLVRGGG